MSKLKNLAINLMIVAGSVFVTLMLIEIILRVFFPIPYSMEVKYIPDGHLGTRLQPNKVYTLGSGGLATINNLGFRRTTDLSYTKPNNMIRFLLIYIIKSLILRNISMIMCI